jgi:hypothetical protein
VYVLQLTQLRPPDKAISKLTKERAPLPAAALF